MAQRIALVIGAFSAAVVLAVGLTAAGFAPGPVAVTDKQPATGQLMTIDNEVELPTPGDEPASLDIKPRTVYVKPAPQRETVVVTQAVPVTRSTASLSQQGRPTLARRDARPARDREEHEVREDREDREDREHDLERAAERHKDAAEDAREAAKQRREHEDEDEDD